MIPENPFDKIHTQEQIANIDRTLSTFELLAQLPTLISTMRTEFDSLRRQVDFLQGEKDELEKKYNSYVNDKLESMDESRFWEVALSPCFESAVRYCIPVNKRPTTAQGLSTRFITMINLKGGVGKTTLTTNLATAFASGNYHDREGKPLKVLVVDLDFQGSLGSMCLSRDTIANTRISTGPACERTVSSWLLREPLKQQNVQFSELIYPSEITAANGNLDVIAADEYLDEVDVQQIVAQVMGARETRFIYRDLFYCPEILSKYDLVFFDCPPRITPSSINALLASDFVIIPTRLDKVNADATARTLRWLGRLQKSDIPGSRPALAGIALNFVTKGQAKWNRDKLFYDLDDYQKEYLPESQQVPANELIFAGEISTTVNVQLPVDGGDKRQPLASKSLNPGTNNASVIQTAFGDLASEIYDKCYKQ